MSVFHLSGPSSALQEMGDPTQPKESQHWTSLETVGRDVLFPSRLLTGGRQAGVAGDLPAFACVGLVTEKRKAEPFDGGNRVRMGSCDLRNATCLELELLLNVLHI